jgi:hypothetical protein
LREKAREEGKEENGVMRDLPGLEINQPDSKVDGLRLQSKRAKLMMNGDGGQGWND